MLRVPSDRWRPGTDDRTREGPAASAICSSSSANGLTVGDHRDLDDCPPAEPAMSSRGDLTRDDTQAAAVSWASGRTQNAVGPYASAIRQRDARWPVRQRSGWQWLHQSRELDSDIGFLLGQPCDSVLRTRALV